MGDNGINDLPPHYDNLNYDAESDREPTAPATDSELEGDRQVLEAPSAPAYEIDLTPKTLTYNPPSLRYEEIYEACMQYVQEFVCYGSKFVKQMQLTEIDNGGAYHYILESFGEKREIVLLKTPYYGQAIDGPENGPPPGPWQIVVRPPVLFQNSQVRSEIPHTAYVTQCGTCVGNRRVRCNSCYGRGGNSCFSCNGTGRRTDGSCISCSGTGRKRCWKCSGTGQVKCAQCNGHGRVKCCKIVIVTWKSHPDDYVSNTSSLPIDLIGKVTGNKMLFEEHERVTPIVNAPHESINIVSAQLIEEHRVSFPQELILKQRHVLRVVPVTRVKYQWKNKEGEFYVYGRERKVYFKEYPQQCCCCTCL